VKARNPVLDPPDLPPGLADFRSKYRREVVGRYYQGTAHLTFVIVVPMALIILAASSIRSPLPLEWLTIPVTFLFANIVEYFGHRKPMHEKIKHMGLMFHRHTLEHHQFFTEQWMTCRSPKDYKIVLFPPVMLFFYVGLVAVPIGTLLFLTWSHNIAWMYVATTMFYFMQYEALHFCYHLDDDFWIAKLPVLSALRRHHQLHHTHELMTRYNFNITWPIADTLFGTLHRAPTPSKNTVGKRVA
jgi:hypothetical protein